MEQIPENGHRVLDDGMRLSAFHVDDESDAARIVFVARIIQPGRGTAGLRKMRA
jgi:hypothetical protein